MSFYKKHPVRYFSLKDTNMGLIMTDIAHKSHYLAYLRKAEATNSLRSGTKDDLGIC